MAFPLEIEVQKIAKKSMGMEGSFYHDSFLQTNSIRTSNGLFNRRGAIIRLFRLKLSRSDL